MNLEMLNKLSTEGLYRLKESIDKVLDGRMDRTPRIGRVGTFTDRAGLTRTASITKINRTTFSCEETGASVNPGGKWKVSMNSFNVTPIERRVNQPARFAAPHRPQTNVGSAW